jgi:hypothetical protein
VRVNQLLKVQTPLSAILSVDKKAAAWVNFLLFRFYYPPFQHVLYYTTFYWKVSSDNNNNNGLSK